MRNPYQPGPLAGGMQSLVGALMGGDATEARAREAATLEALRKQSLTATIEDKVTRAKLNADKRVAQQQHEADLVATGRYTPEQARLIANMNIGGFGANIGRVHEFDLREQALGALQADPNVSEANAVLGALSGKPMPSVDVKGNQIIRAIYGDAPAVSPTEVAQAQAAASYARAGASQAQANLANTRAGQVGRSGSGRGPTPGVGHPGAGLTPTADDMLDFATDPKGLKDSFIQNFGYDAYLSALRDLPSLKPHALRRKPTARDVRALVDKTVSPDDFAKQFGPDALAAVTGHYADKKKGAKAAPAADSPPPAAVTYLRQNPELAADFDKKFGQGAAARALGGGE